MPNMCKHLAHPLRVFAFKRCMPCIHAFHACASAFMHACTFSLCMLCLRTIRVCSLRDMQVLSRHACICMLVFPGHNASVFDACMCLYGAHIIAFQTFHAFIHATMKFMHAPSLYACVCLTLFKHAVTFFREPRLLVVLFTVALLNWSNYASRRTSLALTALTKR